MTLRFTLALCLGLAPAALASEPLPAAVEAALAEAAAVPGARLVAADYKPSLPPGCVPSAASVSRPIEGSGRYPVKLTGQGCGGWAWVRVQVWAPTAVTTRAVKEGEPLGGAVSFVEKEVAPGRPPVGVDPGTVAARALPRGQIVQAAHVRTQGAAPGQAVKVVVVSGSLVIEQNAKTVPCRGGRSCAVLPSGKHVEGQMQDGRLYVEIP